MQPEGGSAKGVRGAQAGLERRRHRGPRRAWGQRADDARGGLHSCGGGAANFRRPRPPSPRACSAAVSSATPSPRAPNPITTSYLAGAVGEGSTSSPSAVKIVERGVGQASGSAAGAAVGPQTGATAAPAVSLGAAAGSCRRLRADRNAAMPPPQGPSETRRASWSAVPTQSAVRAAASAACAAPNTHSCSRQSSSQRRGARAAGTAPNGR